MSGHHPKKRSRASPSARLQHMYGECDSMRPSFVYQYRIQCAIGRRIRTDPREDLHFLIPLVPYKDFHEVFRGFTRTELNGASRQQLRRRAARQHESSQRLLSTNCEYLLDASST